MNKEQKFILRIEKYKQGILDDLNTGRDIHAILQGYGFIYQDEFNKALDWCKININKDLI